MAGSNLKQLYQQIVPFALRDQFAKVRTFLRYRLPNKTGNTWLNLTWRVHPAAQKSRNQLHTLAKCSQRQTLFYHR